MTTEKYQVKISNYFDDTPMWYHNFCESLPRRIDTLVIEKLKEFNGSLPDPFEVDNMTIIEFDTPEDATAFILRWS